MNCWFKKSYIAVFFCLLQGCGLSDGVVRTSTEVPIGNVNDPTAKLRVKYEASEEFGPELIFTEATTSRFRFSLRFKEDAIFRVFLNVDGQKLEMTRQVYKGETYEIWSFFCTREQSITSVDLFFHVDSEGYVKNDPRTTTKIERKSTGEGHFTASSFYFRCPGNTWFQPSIEIKKK